MFFFAIGSEVARISFFIANFVYIVLNLILNLSTIYLLCKGVFFILVHPLIQIIRLLEGDGG